MYLSHLSGSSMFWPKYPSATIVLAVSWMLILKGSLGCISYRSFMSVSAPTLEFHGPIVLNKATVNARLALFQPCNLAPQFEYLFMDLAATPTIIGTSAKGCEPRMQNADVGSPHRFIPSC